MIRHLTIGLLVLAMLCTLPLAQPQQPAERAEYLLYHGASRIGWMRVERETLERDGAKLSREQDTLHMVIRRSFDGQRFEVNGKSETIAGADGALVSTSLTMTTGPQVIVRSAVVEGDGVSFSVVVDSGEPQKIQRPLNNRKPLSSRGAWALLNAEGAPAAGKSITFPSVSLESFSIQEEVWTVRGAVSRQTRSGKPLTGTEVIVQKDGTTTRTVLNESGDALYASMAGGFELEAVDEIPKDFEADVIELESVMSSSVVVKDWRGLASMELTVELRGEDESSESLFDSNEYQEAERLKDRKGYRLVLKDRRLPAGFEAPKLPLAEVPADVQKFLAPTALSQSDDPEIAKAAREAIGEAADSRVAVDKLINWVSAHLKPASGDTSQASAKQAFKERKGDCTEHSVLLVAMARSVGIPARACVGMVYLATEDTAMFGYHAWAEVWLGRWVPVDSTVRELGTSARYIHMEIDEPGETRGAGRIARCLGLGIRPRVDAYTWRQQQERGE